MYDMYPWDSRADSPRTRPPAPRDGEASGTAKTAQDQDPAIRAVQVALDRRDNGGDTGGDTGADSSADADGDTAMTSTHAAVRSGQ